MAYAAHSSAPSQYPQDPSLPTQDNLGYGVHLGKRAREPAYDDWGQKRLRGDDSVASGGSSHTIARSSTSTPRLGAQQEYNGASFASDFNDAEPDQYPPRDYMNVGRIEPHTQATSAQHAPVVAYETSAPMLNPSSNSYSTPSPSLGQSQSNYGDRPPSTSYPNQWGNLQQEQDRGPHPYPMDIRSQPLAFNHGYGQMQYGGDGGYSGHYNTLGTWSESTGPHPYSAGFNGLGLHDPSALYSQQDASLHLKLQSLAVLDNLATQILMNLAKGSYNEIMQLVNGEETEESQAYKTRKNLFDQTRRVYSRETFIDAIAIQLFTSPQQETIRKANKATFVSSILESCDVSFFHLNEFFLEIFVPVGQRLLKWQGDVFLDLKTQTYISALINSDGDVVSFLEELFPQDLEERLIARHPDAPNLTPSEQEFLRQAKVRKEYLKKETETGEDPSVQLPKKYEWYEFVRHFASAVSSNIDNIINPPARTFGTGPGPYQQNSVPVNGLPMPRMQAMPANQAENLHHATASGAWMDSPSRQSPAASSMSNAQRARASPMVASQSTTPTSSAARPSNPAKATASANAPRQPWKQEEEDALLAGLTEVKGPHWSQILSLYGRGGSVSEVLKDRNQIQLKDKARNLKLWYLKMGNEVPACLRGVTGELRKRGGARVRAALGLDGPDEGGGGGGGAGGAARRTPAQGTARRAADTERSSEAAPQIDPALSGQ